MPRYPHDPLLTAEFKRLETRLEQAERVIGLMRSPGFTESFFTALQRGAAAGSILQTAAEGDDPVLIDWTDKPADGDVTAATNLAGNKLMRGDGGAKGAQDTGIAVDDSDNVSGVANLSINGSISGGELALPFVTDVTGRNGAAITDENYEAGTDPAGKVLEDCDTDGDDIRVHVEVDGPTTGWQPANDEVVVSGGDSPAYAGNWTRLGTGARRFSGYADISISTPGATDITVTAADGATAVVEVDRLADPPEVTSATWGQYNGGWSGGEYPTSADTGLQAAVKETDTVDIQLTLDIAADEIRVQASGPSDGQSFTDGPYGPGTVYISGVTINDVANGNEAFTVDARQTGGSYGVSDDTPVIAVNQDAHSYSSFHDLVFNEGAGYFALASGHWMKGDLEITNWSAGNDYAGYVSSEVTISAGDGEGAGDYAETKKYTYASGTYRDSETNVTLTSRRKVNGKQNSTTYLVKICNAAPTLTMTGATARLRSRAAGGDKTYFLMISSNYELMEAPTCSRDSGDDGDALGAWSGSAPDKTWLNTIAIGEEDTKNTGASTYSWNNQTVLATTGSGLTVATVANNSTYTVGGFEERDVAVSKFDQYEPIGTMVTNEDNAANLVMEYVGLGSGTYAENTDDDPGSKKFTIVDSGGSFDADGDYIKCNDSNIYDAVDYTMRIEESA